MPMQHPLDEIAQRRRTKDGIPLRDYVLAMKDHCWSDQPLIRAVIVEFGLSAEHADVFVHRYAPELPHHDPRP